MQVLPEGSDETFLFEEEVVGGRIPKQYIPAVEKGFRKTLAKGPVAGYPVVGLHIVLTDGSYHEVDSSDLAFQICAQTTMRENFSRTKPVLLEPVMRIEIECPTQFQGTVVGDLTSRRGMVTSTEVSGATARIEGEVPLAETFGYSTDLRSMTQGQGTFTMEFARYRRLPASVEREVIAERKKATVGAGA
jgi:elongation factor G